MSAEYLAIDSGDFDLEATSAPIRPTSMRCMRGGNLQARL
jgi:hypothetical protein